MLFLKFFTSVLILDSRSDLDPVTVHIPELISAEMLTSDMFPYLAFIYESIIYSRYIYPTIKRMKIH